MAMFKFIVAVLVYAAVLVGTQVLPGVWGVRIGFVVAIVATAVAVKYIPRLMTKAGG